MTYLDNGTQFQSNIENDESLEFYGNMISSSKLYDLEAIKILQRMLIEKISNLQKTESEIFKNENENVNGNENEKSDTLLKKEITGNNSNSKISKIEVTLLLSLLSLKVNLLKSCLVWTENYVRTITISKNTDVM